MKLRRTLRVALVAASLVGCGASSSQGGADAGDATTPLILLPRPDASREGSRSSTGVTGSRGTSSGLGTTRATGTTHASTSASGTGSGSGNGSSKPMCKYAANQTGLSAFQQAGGLAFHVYAPTSYDPAVAHTVVIIMHGQDSDGTAELSALWQPIADSGEPLVLVAPKGSSPATDPAMYPNGANWSVNDLNHIQDLVGEIDDCYDVNVKKHILWGFSEGCFYGYLLGIGAADQFSGLAMGGANTSFAQENGYPPSAEQWKIPVSHVQGKTDPNGLAPSEADKAAFEAAGSVFTLYEPDQGHTITPAQVLQQYHDLEASTSP